LLAFVIIFTINALIKDHYYIFLDLTQMLPLNRLHTRIVLSKHCGIPSVFRFSLRKPEPTSNDSYSPSEIHTLLTSNRGQCDNDNGKFKKRGINIVSYEFLYIRKTHW